MGVLNVVRMEDWVSSLICRNPDFASKTENTLASGISVMMSSIVFIGWCSRLKTLFKSFGSMHILILSFLQDTTIELTHSVGSFTGVMYPKSSISRSFSIARGLIAAGSLRVGCITPCAFSSIFIEYSPGSVPVVLISSGKSLVSSSSAVSTELTLLNKPNFSATSLLSMFS